MTIINLTTPMSDDKERQQRNKAVLDAIEQYTEMQMTNENIYPSGGSGPGLQTVVIRAGVAACTDRIGGAGVVTHGVVGVATQSDALQAENEQLRHDLERQMSIANEQVNEAERLREALEAAPLIGRTESVYDFMERQEAWLKGPYRAAMQEQST